MMVELFPTFGYPRNPTVSVGAVSFGTSVRNTANVSDVDKIFDVFSSTSADASGAASSTSATAEKKTEVVSDPRKCDAHISRCSSVKKSALFRRTTLALSGETSWTYLARS